eukprot:tig00020723_g13434.t1
MKGIAFLAALPCARWQRQDSAARGVSHAHAAVPHATDVLPATASSGSRASCVGAPRPARRRAFFGSAVPCSFSCAEKARSDPARTRRFFLLPSRPLESPASTSGLAYASAVPQEVAEMLKSEDPKDRHSGLLKLINVEPIEDTKEFVLKMSKDPDSFVRVAAVSMLGSFREPAITEILVALLSSKKEEYRIRANAAGALGNVEDPSAKQALIDAYRGDSEWIVRYSALVSLGHLRYNELPGGEGPAAVQEVFDIAVAALESKEGLIVQAAVGVLGGLALREGVPHLLPRFLRHEDWLTRLRLVETLTLIPATTETALALEVLACDEVEHVALAGRAALAALRSASPALHAPDASTINPLEL